MYKTTFLKKEKTVNRNALIFVEWKGLNKVIMTSIDWIKQRDWQHPWLLLKLTWQRLFCSPIFIFKINSISYIRSVSIKMDMSNYCWKYCPLLFLSGETLALVVFSIPCWFLTLLWGSNQFCTAKKAFVHHLTQQ